MLEWGGKLVVELQKRKGSAEFGGAPWINWREGKRVLQCLLLLNCSLSNSPIYNTYRNHFHFHSLRTKSTYPPPLGSNRHEIRTQFLPLFVPLIGHLVSCRWAPKMCGCGDFLR